MFIVVFTSYIAQFYFLLDYSFSEDTAVWGQLGDYVGGLLNPILSFIALVLLIKSLSLQNEANEGLRSELKRNEKSEKLRSFEALFFGMINSQKELFDALKVEFGQHDTEFTKCSIEAVMEIEDEIERIRDTNGSNEDVRKFLEKIDSKEKIFGLTRSFYIIVKMISDKLSDSHGFDYEDRRSHILTLVNFTDFSLLRLIMISLQFMEYHSTEYLRENKDFNEVLKEVGIDYNLY